MVTKRCHRLSLADPPLPSKRSLLPGLRSSPRTFARYQDFSSIALSRPRSRSELAALPAALSGEPRPRTLPAPPSPANEPRAQPARQSARPAALVAPTINWFNETSITSIKTATGTASRWVGSKRGIARPAPKRQLGVRSGSHLRVPALLPTARRAPASVAQRREGRRGVWEPRATGRDGALAAGELIPAGAGGFGALSPPLLVGD